jgi:hypothetical protein
VAKAGRAHLQRHTEHCCVCVIFVTLQNYCETAVVAYQFFVVCVPSATMGVSS